MATAVSGSDSVHAEARHAIQNGCHYDAAPLQCRMCAMLSDSRRTYAGHTNTHTQTHPPEGHTKLLRNWRQVWVVTNDDRNLTAQLSCFEPDQ